MGSSQTQSENKQTTPWGPQASALQTGFDAAGNALSKSSAAAANEPANYVASFDPALIGQFNNMLGYANKNNTNNLNTAGNEAATSGANASSAALSKLLGYDPTKLNNPQTLIDQANQYVAGQNIPAQVKSAMLNATQTARDVTLPGIEQHAAISGNTDSSRNDIQQGLVERGLAEQSNSLENSLTGQAYGQGLGLASANANANNQSQVTADNAAASGGNTGLYAGSGAVNSSITGQGNIFGIGENAGQGLTSAQQAILNNTAQKYQAGVNDPYAALTPYMKLVGSQLYGTNTTGTTTTTKDPGALDILSGVLGAAGGLASGGADLGWKPFA